jgi:hypothetical protein
VSAISAEHFYEWDVIDRMPPELLPRCYRDVAVLFGNTEAMCAFPDEPLTVQSLA